MAANISSEKVDLVIYGPIRPIVENGFSDQYVVHRAESGEQLNALPTEVKQKLRGMAVTYLTMHTGKEELSQFPKLEMKDWLASAHRMFKEEKGRLVPTYDVKIATTMNGVDAERRVPPLWLQFDALRAKPLMVIRGANSDLLSEATVEAMRERRRDLIAIEVPDQGHAPLLSEPGIIGRIDAFIRSCDTRRTQQAAAG